MLGDEYISKIAEHLKKHEEKRELEMRDALRRAEVRKAKTPALWLELKASLSNAIDRIRKIVPSLNYYDGGFDEAILALAAGTNKHFRDLTVNFDHSTGIISYHSNDNLRGNFEPDVNGDTVFYLDTTFEPENMFHPRAQLPMRADDIAKRLIDVVSERK
jgi:hypothetical protein